MPSKGYKRFKDRLEYFRIDNEIAEIIVLNKELLKGDKFIFNQVTAAKHPLLANRANSASSRNIIVTHFRKTLYVSLIKDMYEEVTEYIRYILCEGALNGANTCRLIGEHNCSISANEILSLTTRQEIIKFIMDQVFQRLENERSTITLISKIQKKLGLTIAAKVIDEALPFLEIRHVFVHSDGKPTQDFLDKYPEIKLDNHNRISVNAAFARKAYNAINNLLIAIDNEMIAKKYISLSELQP